MNYTAKQIAEIINDSLQRNLAIAIVHGETHLKNEKWYVSETTLKEMHSAAAKNLGQILRDAMGDADL